MNELKVSLITPGNIGLLLEDVAAGDLEAKTIATAIDVYAWSDGAACVCSAKFNAALPTIYVVLHNDKEVTVIGFCDECVGGDDYMQVIQRHLEGLGVYEPGAVSHRH